MSSEQDEQRTERDGLRGEGRKRRERQHDPIIVDGQSSMKLEFDDTHDDEEELYKQTKFGELVQFTGERLVITTVTVTDGATSHESSGVPSHGRCTIKIGGRRAGEFDEFIVVEGKDGGVIEIGFKEKAFPQQSSIGHRKRFHQTLRHIKRMTIIDNDTGAKYECDLIQNNGKCKIEITDAHIA